MRGSITNLLHGFFSFDWVMAGIFEYIWDKSPDCVILRRATRLLRNWQTIKYTTI